MSDFCEDVPGVAASRGLFITELMGSNVSWLLFGFILKQSYTYYRRSKVRADTLWLRLLVLGTIAIQVIDTAVSAYIAYALNADSWGNTADFGELGPVIAEDITVLTLTVASLFTQIFYVWRIWTFSEAVGKNRLKVLCRIASVLIILLNIGATACGLFSFVESFLPNPVSNWYIYLLAMNAGIGAADILITVFMMILLSRARAQTSFRGTRGALSRISLITLQSGLLSTILTVCMTSLNGVGISIYGIFWELSTKSYAISLFANLNARSRTGGDVEHIPSEYWHDQDHDASYGFGNQPHPQIIEGAKQENGES